MSIEVYVRCSNQKHRVILADSGALAFPDHPPGDLVAEMALKGLGGTVCRCAAILSAWRSRRRKEWKALPKRLVELRGIAADRGDDRRQIQYLHKVSVAPCIRENLSPKEIARTVAAQADYRRPDVMPYIDERYSRFVQNDKVLLHGMSISVEYADESALPGIVGGGPNLWKAGGDYRNAKGHHGGLYFSLLIWIEPDTWQEVYRQAGGLAHEPENGRRIFVVKLLEETLLGREYVALAGKQGLGLRVDQARCRIRRCEGESWEVVEWLD